MSKYTLAQDMFQDIPEALRNLLETQIGNFSPLPRPTTEEEANITAGQFLADFQNHILVPFSGLPIVSMMLYVGSLNPSIVSGLFANLEYLGGGGALDIISPKDGGIYPGYFDTWQIRGTDLDAVTVMIGEDEFSLNRNDNDFSKNWPVAIGEHTATITGYREEEEIDAVTVSFSVLSWEVWPPDGSEIGTGEHTITVDTGGNEVESAKATVTTPDGSALNLVFDFIGGIYQVAVSMGTAGLYLLAFEFTLPASIGVSYHQWEQQVTTVEVPPA